MSDNFQSSARNLQEEWEQERQQLQNEQARQLRLAATVSNEIYDEAKVCGITFQSFLCNE